MVIQIMHVFVHKLKVCRISLGLKIFGLCFVSKNKPVVESSLVAEIFSGADAEVQ